MLLINPLENKLILVNRTLKRLKTFTITQHKPHVFIIIIISIKNNLEWNYKGIQFKLPFSCTNDFECPTFDFICSIITVLTVSVPKRTLFYSILLQMVCSNQVLWLPRYRRMHYHNSRGFSTIKTFVSCVTRHLKCTHACESKNTH